MDVFNAIKWRRSVRKFSARPVEREKLLQILEAGRLAPSSSNQQAWHFVVIDDRQTIKQIPKQVALGSKIAVSWLNEAPVVVAGCYTKALTHHIARAFGHENHLIDVSIALTQIVLAATALQIGSCFVGWFNQKKLKKLLAVPANYQIACLVAFGYPADASTAESIGGIPARPRKKLEEIVSFNRWGNR